MWANILIILNLFVLEALLSVDNAAVLAVLVKDLPGNDSKKALKWGMWGAYILRGACLFIASALVKLWWLKCIGGVYLMYLSIGHFTKAKDTLEEDVAEGTSNSKVYAWLKKHTGMSQLWATICLVEIMDLVFSIDNIFASVALSDQMWVIITGVFLGIAAMRFVATWFLKLMQKHPSLEKSAFIVILLLGVKLTLSGLAEWFSVLAPIHHVLEMHMTDLIFSAATMLIFFIPLLYGKKAEQESSIYDTH